MIGVKYKKPPQRRCTEDQARGVGRDRVCPVCGKEFLQCTAEWGWSVELGYGRTARLCSYGCMRKVERNEVKLR